jgi:hypothetical protein
MRDAEWVNVVYFAGLTILASFTPLPLSSRMKAVVLGFAGILVTLTMPYSSEALRNWTPVPLMAMAYWQSGCFFRKPNERLQSAFDRWDGKILGILKTEAVGDWPQRWIMPVLELTYLLCYPVVPLGVAALYLAGMPERVADFWFIVLLSAYPCYALLPFMPMLPPRLLKGGGRWPPHAGKLRRFNLWVVRGVTHQATTFPSGHVAASAAIALVLLRFAPSFGIVFLLIAIGIALGCISGRYHYALDVIAALVLAILIFSIVTAFG